MVINYDLNTYLKLAYFYMEYVFVAGVVTANGTGDIFPYNIFDSKRSNECISFACLFFYSLLLIFRLVKVFRT